MPYKIDPKNKKCVVKADSGKRVGCTKGSVKKYLAALYANVKDVNESEEFDWVENPVQYIKVGQRFNVKTSAEPITVQIVRIVEKPDFNRNTIYFSPINLVGTKYPGVPMNVQRLLTHINSGSWTPIKKINESEDDFEWAQETIKTSFLEFNGKEIMIDIQDLDEEELKKLYEIVSPYISKSDWFTTNEGEEVIWKDNDKCFKKMLTNGSGKFKTISLHCGIEDNDYLPLKGALCCLKTTYQEEIIQPYMSEMDNTTFINGRDLIGYPINESEWFEDVVKDPIMLKVEDLEMGDIVIPTRFNQQEYIVTGKGTSVKLLDTPTHWVTLKRNTKENTGGVFIEHDSEIGKACRFELIHREENINESEEFEWAEDIIANTTEEIDISNDFDLWKNKLVEGSVVKITGGWENMDFEDDITTIVNPPDEAGNYLLKFDRIIYEFGNEDEGNHTHCGENETQNIKCECQRKQKLRSTFVIGDEVGKCWWTNLSQMDKVIYLPFEGKQITESEEDSELFWAEDLLDFNNPINITDKLDFMEELPVGSILQVQGYQDEMELDMEEVKLIDKAEGQGYDSTYYLFKLKYERGTDGSERSHCGKGQKNMKICECRDTSEDDDYYQSEIGKCWWIELKNQNKVIYYPNRIDLSENKIKKPLLTEGRYDTITRKVVRDIMKAVTEGDSDSYNLPWDISTEQEYEQEGLSFSLELDIVRTNDVEIFEVRTAVADEDDENIIMMTIILGPRFNSQKLEKLFYKLQEDIRHEIEHFTQIGPNRIKDRPTYKGSTANLKTTYGHHKNVIEVPALVHGFYRRAKLEKRPLDEIMMDDLDSEIERGLLTKNQAQKLLTLWIHYAKKNLPSAIYKEN